MAVKYACAALRISSSTMSASLISNSLKIKGGRLIEPKAKNHIEKNIAGQVPESRWIFESPLDDSRPISEHVDFILKLIEEHLDEFREIVKQGEIDIWCTVTIGDSQGGVDLDPSLIKRLTVVPIRIIFGLYSE